MKYYLVISLLSSLLWGIPVSDGFANQPMHNESLSLTQNSEENQGEKKSYSKDMQHSENNSIIFDEMFKEGPEENQEREKFFIQFMNMLSTLALIIIFMLLAAWSLKRFLNQRSLNVNTDCEIRILEKRSLSPKSQLYLIETCDKKILIAESPSGVSLISQDLIARKVNENYPKENFS